MDGEQACKTGSVPLYWMNNGGQTAVCFNTVKTNTFSTLFILAGFCAGLAGTASGQFVPVNATYNGMFSEADGWWEQSAGTLTLKSTSRAQLQRETANRPGAVFL